MFEDEVFKFLEVRSDRGREGGGKSREVGCIFRLVAVLGGRWG